MYHTYYKCNALNCVRSYSIHTCTPVMYVVYDELHITYHILVHVRITLLLLVLLLYIASSN